MVSLNFDTKIAPFASPLINMTESLSNAGGIGKGFLGARVTGTLAGVAVLADGVAHLGAAVAKLFTLRITDAAVHTVKAVRNVVCAVVLTAIGLVAPSYQAVASRAFGTSQAPVEAKTGRLDNLINALKDPVGTVKSNQRAFAVVTTAVVALAAGLGVGQYMGWNRVALDFASSQGAAVVDLANEWVAKPVLNVLSPVTGAVASTFDSIRGLFTTTAPGEKKQPQGGNLCNLGATYFCEAK